MLICSVLTNFASHFKESGVSEELGVDSLLSALKSHPRLHDAVAPSIAAELRTKSLTVDLLLQTVLQMHRLTSPTMLPVHAPFRPFAPGQSNAFAA